MTPSYFVFEFANRPTGSSLQNRSFPSGGAIAVLCLALLLLVCAFVRTKLCFRFPILPLADSCIYKARRERVFGQL